MFRHKKTTISKKFNKKQKSKSKNVYDPYEYKKQIEESIIEIKIAPTLNDKFEVLDNYYAWLSDEDRDANLAQNLTKYKNILRHKEFLRGEVKK